MGRVRLYPSFSLGSAPRPPLPFWIGSGSLPFLLAGPGLPHPFLLGRGLTNPDPKGQPHSKSQPLSSFPPPSDIIIIVCFFIKITMITTQSWPTPTPRRTNQPQLQTREGPTLTPKKSPTPTKEKEGPNNPREGRATPLQRVGRAYLSMLINLMIHIIMSLPILPFGVGSGLTLPSLLGQACPRAWPSPSFPFGWALAFPLSPFGLGLAFLSFGSGPGQPRPREGRAKTPTPRKKNPKRRKRLSKNMKTTNYEEHENQKKTETLSKKQ